MAFFTLERGPFPSDVRARVARAIGEIPAFVTELLTEVGTESVAMLHDATPIGTGHTGGHLADSYSSTVEDDTLSVKTDQAMKLNWVRYGTPSPILPTTRRALMWEGAAHPYASVRGQAANDFVTPVIDEVDTLVADQLEPLAQKILATLQGG